MNREQGHLLAPVYRLLFTVRAHDGIAVSVRKVHPPQQGPEARIPVRKARTDGVLFDRQPSFIHGRVARGITALLMASTNRLGRTPGYSSWDQLRMTRIASQSGMMKRNCPPYPE